MGMKGWQLIIEAFKNATITDYIEALGQEFFTIYSIPFNKITNLLVNIVLRKGG